MEECKNDILLTYEKLDVQKAFDTITSPYCGGSSFFLGKLPLVYELEHTHTPCEKLNSVSFFSFNDFILSFTSFRFYRRRWTVLYDFTEDARLYLKAQGYLCPSLYDVRLEPTTSRYMDKNI